MVFVLGQQTSRIETRRLRTGEEIQAGEDVGYNDWKCKDSASEVSLLQSIDQI